MRDSLIQAIEMAKKVGYVFLTTADGQGNPHLSIVQPISVDQLNRLKLMAWLCQNALNNLQENTKVSLVVWDPVQDAGYQLPGVMDDIEQVAQLNGYAAGLEEKKHFPQIEWRILVRIEKVLNFQKAPHIDVEV